MTLHNGDPVVINWDGKTVRGWIVIASENQVSLLVSWDYKTYDRLIAGHLGTMALLRNRDGSYRTLQGRENITIEAVQ